MGNVWDETLILGYGYSLRVRRRNENRLLSLWRGEEHIPVHGTTHPSRKSRQPRKALKPLLVLEYLVRNRGVVF